MNIQNQINLILQFLSVNEYRSVERVEISKGEVVYVYVAPSEYYTIHSIWQNDEFESFTDADIEELLQSEDRTAAIKALAA